MPLIYESDNVLMELFPVHDAANMIASQRAIWVLLGMLPIWQVRQAALITHCGSMVSL